MAGDNDKMHNEDYAVAAYEKFKKSLGHQTLSGDKMPLWDDLPGILQESWCRAATVVVDMVKSW